MVDPVDPKRLRPDDLMSLKKSKTIPTVSRAKVGHKRIFYFFSVPIISSGVVHRLHPRLINISVQFTTSGPPRADILIT